MSAVLPKGPTAYRLLATTGLHRGDRPYQQDQVQIMQHLRVNGVLLAVLADGMGGKSGGRKAADQVVHTARQLFDRYLPGKDDPEELMRQLVLEAHLMIKLTAITAEEEPHSTLAAFLLGPGLACHIVHAGDSRVYHFRGAELISRTVDNSSATPDRRRLDHRGPGQQPPAGQPADRLPGHRRRATGDVEPHRCGAGRRHPAVLQRRAVALLHPA